MKILLCTVSALLLQGSVLGLAKNCLENGCEGGGMCVDHGNDNYRCSCEVGMIGNETHCIAEQGGFVAGCHTTGCVDGECRDQPDGSTTCVCDPGKVLDPKDNKACIKDVATCPITPCKDGTCQRQPDGSDVCVCSDGYVLSETDPTLCVPRASAYQQDNCLARPCRYGVCENKMGVYQCQCIQGYRLSTTDNSVCEPIAPGPAPTLNPCATVPCTNGQCVLNMYGSPVCSCYPGFMPSPVRQYACDRIYAPPPTSCTCSNGQCQLQTDGSNVCVCNYSYRKDPYNPTNCIRKIHPTCTCTNGRCQQRTVGTNFCVCNHGYRNEPSNPMRCIPIRSQPNPVNPYPYNWNDMMSVWGMQFLLDEMR